jgi:uncharacterized protein (TIGR02271 family)
MDMLLSKTIVGLFKNRNEVDDVLADLRKTGISNDAIKVVDRHELATQESFVGEEGVLKRLFDKQGYVEFEHGALYTDWVRNGGLLVGVNTDDSHSGRVKEIMKGYSAADVTRHMSKTEFERGPEQKQMTETMRPANVQRTEAVERTAQLGRSTKEEETIPVIQEELHVGKRKVQRSTVRITRHVTETPVEETISLRDETVIIDRHPAERIASETDIKALADSQVEMIETAEEPVVSKEAHVVEEITVTKNVVDHEEKIRDKVRKTDIDVEGLAPEKLRDLGFRKHFNTRLGKLGRSYSEYAPAYEFGSTMASDARYRNRDWASIESETRRLWEAKGRSWKDFGEAIRHGWESARSGHAA